MGSRNLILIGFMGTGKSTLGRLCAAQLGYDFHDTDTVIEARAGRTIAQIFIEQGEAAFRAIERAVVAELASQSGKVIATGGGTILDPENVARLREGGWVVLLTARPHEILARVGDARSRPLLASAPDPLERIVELLGAREPLYAGAAHFRADTSGVMPEAFAADLALLYQHVKKPSMKLTTIPVSLGARSYTISIGEELLRTGRAAEIIASVAPGKRACIVTHPGLQADYADPLQKALTAEGIATTLETIPAGERVKNLNTVARLYAAFLQAKLDRKSLVIAVGGGVLGDLVGFAAASYLRGVAFVQVPTTLLAQVDASVGGKTGVDLPQGKNLVGAFHQPLAVLIDPATLRTLPARELRAGLAEVIKYGIIYDKAFFEQITADLPALLRREPAALERAIARSCEIKADVVAQDETEQGLRAILNFGHTIGHALEAVTNYRRYKHGEAVAIGMVSAALIGEACGVTPPTVTARIIAALRSARLPFAFPADIADDAILQAAQRDKKVEAGTLRFVLARDIGDVFISAEVGTDAVRMALARQRHLS